MEIVRFESDMAAAVARCYNDLIEPVPECYPVAADTFADAARLAAKHEGRLRDERLMVARGAAGDVAGFVHVGIASRTEHDDFMKGDEPAIRFLAYRPGQRSVGQALLQWAEDWAKDRGFEAVCAWVCGWRYRFYHFPCAHLSQRIGHVSALFGMNGYRVVDSEIYLTWNDFQPPKPSPPALDFNLAVTPTRGQFGPCLEVKAMAGEKALGLCHMDRGQASPGPHAMDWCYCDNLWVTDRLQGKRLGTFLLSTTLTEMRRAGCKHAAISTGGTNYRAQLMYTNMGFQVVDHTVAFRKELAK